jgi:GMP synthase-like glutamine amidotransferase
MKISILQHVKFEGPGYIKKWAEKNGHELEVTHIHRNSKFPDIESFDTLIVMGGPMGVNDEYAWLIKEKEFLRQAVLSEKKMIGICLGAQLIAHVLGAGVSKNKFKEIGWFKINIKKSGKNLQILNGLPENIDAFHWHGDTFEIPANAASLFESEACKNQGFIFENRILGFQFHLEILKEGIENLLINCSDELVPGKYIQGIELIRKRINEKAGAANSFMEKILNNFYE